ncbi:MAG: hypothetical protein ACR2PR_02535 [Pseudohongiellaceae bacterium]
MGLFRELFGSGVDKKALIKELTKSRVRDDFMAAAMGFDESMVDSLSGIQIMGLPESTIVTIVQTWATLRKRGVSDEEIIMRIERHRSRFKDGGNLPSPLTLSSYIKHRVNLEHAIGAPIEDSFIEEAVELSKQRYLPQAK